MIVDLSVSSLIIVSLALFILKLCCKVHKIPQTVLFFGVVFIFYQYEISLAVPLSAFHLEFHFVW